MEGLVALAPVDTGLLAVRLVVGLLMVGHGLGNLFGWLGGFGLDGTGAIFERLGYRPGRRFAALAGTVEVLAGLGLVAGLATALAAAAVVGTMLTTIRSAHRGKGPWYFDGGWEYNLTLLVVAAAVAVTGPGAVSLDEELGVGLAGHGWGLAALVVGLAMGALPRAPPPPAAVREPVEGPA
jgi:putative oxidoreductase